MRGQSRDKVSGHDPLKQAVREVLTRDGIATYGHVRVQVPGISTKNITRIFRSLEHEGFLRRGLRRGQHGGIWHVAKYVPEWKPLARATRDSFSDELLGQIRQFVLETQSASTTIIQYVFGIGVDTCLDVLHHLRREGIVAKSREKHAHWRVVMRKDTARELGLLSGIRQPPAIAVIEKPEPVDALLAEKVRVLEHCTAFVGTEDSLGKTIVAIKEDVQRLATYERAVKKLVHQVALLTPRM